MIILYIAIWLAGVLLSLVGYTIYTVREFRHSDDYYHVVNSKTPEELTRFWYYHYFSDFGSVSAGAIVMALWPIVLPIVLLHYGSTSASRVWAKLVLGAGSGGEEVDS